MDHECPFLDFLVALFSSCNLICVQFKEPKVILNLKLKYQILQQLFGFLILIACKILLGLIKVDKNNLLSFERWAIMPKTCVPSN